MNIKSNQIKKISKDIILPKTLLYLDISDNQIEEIHEEFFKKCTLLKEIKLFVNKLQILPSSLYKLENLLVLDTTKNKLKEISKDIGNMKSLTNVFLYY